MKDWEKAKFSLSIRQVALADNIAAQLTVWLSGL